jgi:hypothetical protein
MNQFKKFIGAAALAAVAVILPSCGNDTKENAGDSAAHAEDGHEHTFACPMHPEVTGHEGENCPKCGMKLVHNDNAGNTNTYFMQFTGTPAQPKAGEEVTLSFTPKIKGKESDQVPLDVVHEKKIHLIMVSKDLSWYDHIHPDYQADGSYTVKTKFPAAGEYTLFADYAPTGSNHQLEKVTFNVSGTAPAAVATGGQRLTGKADGYEVTITNESAIVTNNLLHMGAIIRKDGKEIPADQLENYLGAKAHVVIVGLDTKEYMHVHPEIVDGKFDLHTTFDKPGIYKGWIQFQANGQVHTADFVLDVKEGKAGDVKGHEHGAGDGHDHGHDHDHGHQH